MHIPTVTLVEIALGALGVILVGLLGVCWKLIGNQFQQHDERIEKLEGKVDNIVVSELRKMNDDISELRGELKVLRTELKSTLDQNSMKLDSLTTSVASSVTLAINGVVSKAIEELKKTE